MSTGGVKGGKRCRFHAADGDVSFSIIDGSTDYSRLGRVGDGIYNWLSQVV